MEPYIPEVLDKYMCLSIILFVIIFQRLIHKSFISVIQRMNVRFVMSLSSHLLGMPEVCMGLFSLLEYNHCCVLACYNNP